MTGPRMSPTATPRDQRRGSLRLALGSAWPGPAAGSALVRVPPDPERRGPPRQRPGRRRPDAARRARGPLAMALPGDALHGDPGPASRARRRCWGPTPITLVSGGLVAYELLVLATFLLAWRAFGPGVAAWAPGAPGVRLDRDGLALGPDHRRAPADGGLARRRPSRCCTTPWHRGACAGLRPWGSGAGWGSTSTRCCLMTPGRPGRRGGVVGAPGRIADLGRHG